MKLPKAAGVILGAVFTLVWIGAHAFWGLLAFMGMAFMNDSGRIPDAAHEAIADGVPVGIFIAAIAGIPAGLAFFWREERRLLVKCFGALFLMGVFIQIGLVALGEAHLRGLM